MSRIQISRSRYIEESRAIADLRLTEYSFLSGELVEVRYYKEPDKRTNIGVLLALGVKDGVGEDCYRIISSGGEVKARYVGTDLPDVSKLIHGELYVVQDEEGVWNYVYKMDNSSSRIIEPITEGPYIFQDLDSGYRWFYENQECKREDDFFSSEKITNILTSVGSIKLKPIITSDVGYIFKKGEVKDLVLDIKVLDELTEDDLTEDCEFYVKGERLILSSEGKLIIPNLVDDEDIKVITKYPVYPGIYLSTSDIVSIKFGYPFYYGVIGDLWEPSEKSILSLSNNIINYRKEWEWTGIDFSYKRVAIAYPKKYGTLAHIYDDNGLDYIRTYQPYYTKVVLWGEEYLVYVKKDVVSVSLFSQRYVFHKTNSLSLGERNLIEIIDAWKRQNSALGLVVLDEDGNIAGDLVKNGRFEIFTTIKAMVEDYPTSDMEEGDVYFNTITKKMFFSIDSETGIIDEPIQKALYLYEGKFYTWSGTEFQEISYLQTREIKSIKEIYGRD